MGELTFLADSFATYTEPGIGRAAVELLEHAGWRVRLESRGCCGRSSLSKGLVDDAKAKGARVLAGGEPGTSGFFFQPTVLADVPDDAQAMNVEPFGPVALMRSFVTEDEALHQANRLPYGLAAFVFTENGRRANRLGDAIESGMVGINTFAISVADAPFGGIKESGSGSEGGIEGLASYQVTKAIHQA